ncbi:hypothetical protein P7K49_012315 [Saguinus oedipus]|uniref:Uncharacterized protein n=1 Tax=Saguinus oedipus TaxID=9490 RepID=A0ABQ9VVH9_SAGOE|nr:hypothetical protein P7K49_012315 [Saguinus oedipus]
MASNSALLEGKGSHTKQRTFDSDPGFCDTAHLQCGKDSGSRVKDGWAVSGTVVMQVEGKVMQAGNEAPATTLTKGQSRLDLVTSAICREGRASSMTHGFWPGVAGLGGPSISTPLCCHYSNGSEPLSLTGP